MESLAALHQKVVFGQSGGRIVWQPRVGCWYRDKMFSGEGLPAPYTGMDRPALYRALGCSARVYEYNACFKAVEDPSVRREERKLNDTDTEIVFHTPLGRQTLVNRTSPNTFAVSHPKWPIETLDDLRVATWRAENTEWRWDQAAFDRVRAEWGDLGAPTMYMPRVNVQDLYINQMGTERAIYAVCDWQAEVDAYFRALDACHDRLMDVIAASPIEIINFGDNLHAGTLSPSWFVKYVLPAYQRRCERLHVAGKFCHAHWDGDTGPLLPFARETGLDGIEAITPQPQGDVTLEEVREALGSEMFLIDGLPAVYFDHTFSEETLAACARRIIDLFAPRLVLGISDEISSTGDIERIRLVGGIVDDYNRRIAATGE